MSPAINLGELFIVGLSGLELTDRERELIRAFKPGGFIFFSRNYQSPEQIKTLIAAIKSASEDRPLFLSVDQEGGAVQRFKEPFTRVPALRRLGEAGNLELARRVGAMMGRELAAVGANLDFAPVLDVDSNPRNPVIGPRAFGADPERVRDLGAAFIAGLQSQGVMACGKHFPGHGDTDADSHKELPEVKHPLEVLRRREWLPFIGAAQAGVAFMMSAHVLFPQIDPEQPATLSPIFMRILREEIGHRGLVITDDLGMAAISRKRSLTEGCLAALAAGVDVLLVADQPAAWQEALPEVLRAVANDGRLLSQAEAALNRIASTKAKWLTPRTPPPLAVIGCAEHRELMSRLS